MVELLLFVKICWIFWCLIVVIDIMAELSLIENILVQVLLVNWRPTRKPLSKPTNKTCFYCYVKVEIQLARLWLCSLSSLFQDLPCRVSYILLDWMLYMAIWLLKAKARVWLFKNARALLLGLTLAAICRQAMLMIIIIKEMLIDMTIYNNILSIYIFQ